MIGALRNQKCRCGSGRKYKKCCYDKDNARRLEGSPYKANSWKQRQLDKKARRAARRRARNIAEALATQNKVEQSEIKSD